MNSIKLLLLKVFFGKFSYDYQNKFFQLNNYGKSRKKHLQECSRINGYGHLFAAFEFDRKITVVTSQETITFQDIKPYEKFRKFIGKHKNYIGYDIERYDSIYWKRIAYKAKMFNTKPRIIYHFINNLFFFGEIFFSDARNINIEEIRKSLCEKYGINSISMEEKFKIYTPDAFIFFDFSGINLSIKYVFTTDKTINDIVTNQIMKIGRKTQDVLEIPLEEMF